jgi:hypothetical protein
LERQFLEHYAMARFGVQNYVAHKSFGRMTENLDQEPIRDHQRSRSAYQSYFDSTKIHPDHSKSGQGRIADSELKQMGDLTE